MTMLLAANAAVFLAPIWRVLVALGAVASRSINAIVFDGSMHQSLSARSHVEAARDPTWARRRDRIDRLFSLVERDHCAVAWADEVRRARRTLALNEAPVLASGD